MQLLQAELLLWGGEEKNRWKLDRLDPSVDQIQWDSYGFTRIYGDLMEVNGVYLAIYQVTVEHGPFSLVFAIKRMIFHGYLGLPEGS